MAAPYAGRDVRRGRSCQPHYPTTRDATFAGSYYQLREAIRQLALLPYSGTEAETAASNALERGAEFNQAIIAVWLHGSAPVIASAHQVEGAINALYVTARASKLSWDEWVVQRRAAQHALHEL